MKYVIYKRNNQKNEVVEVVKAKNLAEAKRYAFRKYGDGVLNLKYQLGVVTEATAKREYII